MGILEAAVDYKSYSNSSVQSTSTRIERVPEGPWQPRIRSTVRCRGRDNCVHLQMARCRSFVISGRVSRRRKVCTALVQLRYF